MPPLPAEQPSSRPRPRIGRYAITGRIGQGGMGRVYRALDEALDREVALKTLTLEGTLDAESRGRFQIEAKAAARLQHPNIITVYELGEDRGVPFIAMELLPGADLEGVRRAPEGLTLEEALDVLCQVLRGLAYAHEHGVLHRDVKPSNVRVLDDGTVKLMDFGIAKLGDTGVTRAGMMVGTVYYMSPEQIRGQQLDGRSDVFSVGVMLYELLSGRRPFSGGSSTEVLYKIVHDPTPALPANLGAQRDELQAIVERALAKKPEDRFAGAGAMADVLDAARSRCRPVPDARETQEVEEGLRLLRAGDASGALTIARHTLEKHPQSIAGRRLARAARRTSSETGPRAAEPDDYPELDATFRSEPTRQTALAPTQSVTSVAAPAESHRGLAWAAAVGLAAAVGAGVALLMGRGAEPPAPVTSRVEVRSEPTGAQVLLDGQPSGVRTDGVLELPGGEATQAILTFRLEGYQDATRPVSLPPAPGTAISVELQRQLVELGVETRPPGATARLNGEDVAGQTPLTLRLDPGRDYRLVLSRPGYEDATVDLDKGAFPEAVSLDLPKPTPPGSVRVVSDYPVDVVWNGKTVARGQSGARVSVPAGQQRVTLRSGEHFLDMTASLDVPAGGEATLRAPPLGRISIRANPDNCEILIDGTFADYPPILDKAIAAGVHVVGFRWPDGRLREERTEISAGRVSYVQGRRD